MMNFDFMEGFKKKSKRPTTASCKNHHHVHLRKSSNSFNVRTAREDSQVHSQKVNFFLTCSK